MLASPYTPTLGTSAVSGYISPASLPKPVTIGGAILVPIAVGTIATEIIGRAGGYSFLGTQLAKVEAIAGKRTVSEPPPFNGGQVSGIMYRVNFTDLVSQGVGNTETRDLQGKIGIPYKEGGNWYLPYMDGSQRLNRGGNSYYGLGRDVIGIRINSIIRLDGLPDVSIETPTSTESSGFSGTESELDRKQRNMPVITPPNFSPALGWGNGKPLDGRAALGIGSIRLGEGFAMNLDPKLKAPILTPNLPDITPKRPPTTPKKEEDRRSPFVPTPSELGNINTKLFEIGSILGVIQASQGTISNNINDIKNNTSTQNLENAAQTGSCRSLQSPSCTSQLKDAIKNPLEAKLDAAQVARDTNAAAQSAALTVIAVEQQAQKGVLASILSKAGEIFDRVGALWNNSLIDKAMQYITMITVIHNAVMLTRGIGDTLGSALDSGLQALGLQIKDKDGNQQGVTQIIGKSFENLIKGIIGNANYTALTETWIQANRVYQSGINLLSNVQNILDSTTAIAELTSNRVGTLMNALRNAGMVREDAYGAQSQNVTRFNAFMDKLEALEQGTSNVAAITGNIVSVQQSVNELKTNRQELENALKNKPVGTGAPENKPESDAKQEKREESVFKINDFSIVRAPEETN
ncbi:hypothetical protein [Pseudanabaena sp. ABRG5-3]|uniref:hypothetical protein n=1 Tax=Pseudanabaena sp. ABRG5-3 TaxID=685565 RepID=UPI000DC71862|nr:hypothetical protein [Pseudanabaena sp. ABRG5-3]BBC24774.1 hypothetical protein ABRG53_2517 [Pseudanabaena sp. ABRG5-3]